MVRNAFLKRVTSALETLDDEIDRLSAKAEKVGRDAKVRYDEELAILHMKREAVRAKVEQVRNAGAGSWGALKGGVQDATDDLRKAIDKAIERLRKSA